MIGKELPGINQNRSSSNNRNLDQSHDRDGHSNDLNSSYHYKKRNASGNNRNMIHISNSLNGVQYNSNNGHHLNMTPSKLAAHGKGNNHVINTGLNSIHGLNSLNLGNSKTPKEQFKRIQ